MTPSSPTLQLPCVEALLAGTIAAMTAWADPCPRCAIEPARQRAVLARKLVANLGLLAQHPGLGPELRQVMAMALERWAGVQAATASPHPCADAHADAHADHNRPTAVSPGGATRPTPWLH